MPKGVTANIRNYTAYISFRQAGYSFACSDLSHLASGFTHHRNQVDEPPLHARANYPPPVTTSHHQSLFLKEKRETAQRNEPSLGLIYSITAM